MSFPTADPTIRVRPDLVTGLAGELSALAGELTDDAGLCRSAATSLRSALAAEVGWAAGAAATAWAALTGTLAERSGAIAGTLREALDSYGAMEAALARELGRATPDEPAARP